MVSEINGMNKINNQYQKELNPFSNNRYGELFEYKNSAVIADGDDEGLVEYSITNDGDNINESKELVDRAKKNKNNLCNILIQLVSKSDEQSNKMEDIKKDLQSCGAEVTKKTDENGKVVIDAKAETDDYKSKMQEQQKEITDLKLQMKRNSVDMRSGGDKAALRAENEKLQSEINRISGEYDEYKTSIVDSITSARGAITKNGNSMQGIVNKAQSSLSSAVNSNELADITIEKGLEVIDMVKNLNPNNIKENLKDTGFIADEGDFNQVLLGSLNAVFVGSAAITAGSKLGELSTVVANQVKDVSEKCDIEVAKDYKLNALSKKSYYDTQGTNIYSVAGSVIEDRDKIDK